MSGNWTWGPEIKKKLSKQLNFELNSGVLRVKFDWLVLFIFLLRKSDGGALILNKSAYDKKIDWCL